MKPVYHVKPSRNAISTRLLTEAVCMLAALVSLALPAIALDGQVSIHDPATIMECDGKYYTFGTGGTALVSDDGWTWQAGERAPQSGMAPDLIHVGDRYYQYISRNVGGQPAAEITMIWTKSLDPESPDYKWVDEGQISSTDGIEFCNGIDPGLFLDPNTGKMWMTYGSYFGYIRVVELDPETGLRVDPDKFYNIGINCEATTMIYKDGWYYLLGTHGSCCAGTNSGYNIRVGRSRNVTGPFVDHNGIGMLEGGGKLFLTSNGRYVGPGHFGLIDCGDGVQKFSIHYEADMDRGGASIVEILPLQWEDGWPVAGANLKEGTYQFESVRTGTALELAVESVQVGGPRRRGMTGGGGGGMFGGSGEPIADQTPADVSENWPAGNVNVRLANYMCQAQQKWAITPVADAGGYLGSPYFRITIAGTDRALAAGSNGELITVSAFTGGDAQLWRFDQLDDGTWRIMPKVTPNSSEPLALSALGSSYATLQKYDPTSNKQRWFLKMP